jgi:predicted nuclease with TOPRIM domain
VSEWVTCEEKLADALVENAALVVENAGLQALLDGARTEVESLRGDLAVAREERDGARRESAALKLEDYGVVGDLLEAEVERNHLRAALEPTTENIEAYSRAFNAGASVELPAFIAGCLAAIRARAGLT